MCSFRGDASTGGGLTDWMEGCSGLWASQSLGACSSPSCSLSHCAAGPGSTFRTQSRARGNCIDTLSQPQLFPAPDTAQQSRPDGRGINGKPTLCGSWVEGRIHHAAARAEPMPSHGFWSGQSGSQLSPGKGCPSSCKRLVAPCRGPRPGAHHEQLGGTNS